MNLDVVKILKTLIVLVVLTFISCEKDVSTSPPEPEPPHGFIFVDSNPHNYKIYLDNRFTGRFTPDTLPYVEETEHLIELKRKYWLDSSAITFAKREITNSVYIDFLQNPKVYGTLNFKSKPEGVFVVINDSLTSIRTPYVLGGVLPGVYDIKYQLTDYRSTQARVIVESNKTRTITLSLQDTSVWVDFTTKNSILPNDNITTITVDHDNRVWVGMAKAGILTIKGNSWQLINKSNSGLPSDSISVIKVDKNNTKWIATAKGLAAFKNGMVQRVYDNSNSAIGANNKIYALGFYENLVFAGTSKGILKIENDETVLYEIKNSNGNGLVTAIEVDEDNSQIWVGIIGGLYNYNIKDNDLFMNRKSGNTSSTLENLYLTKVKIRPEDGRLWALFSSASTFGQAGDLLLLPSYIIVWAGDRWLYQRLESGTENLYLTDIAFDKNNFVWITTNQGLRKNITRHPGEVLRAYNTGLFNDDLTAVEVDQNDILWIGSKYGLYKYKKNLDTQ